MPSRMAGAGCADEKNPRLAVKRGGANLDDAAQAKGEVAVSRLCAHDFAGGTCVLRNDDFKEKLSPICRLIGKKISLSTKDQERSESLVIVGVCLFLFGA